LPGETGGSGEALGVFSAFFGEVFDFVLLNLLYELEKKK
jgi:hypothetical protein